MQYRDISFAKFRKFIEHPDQWLGLPKIDAIFRLVLLSRFFADQSGIRLRTYYEEAWRLRFKDEYSLSKNDFFAQINLASSNKHKLDTFSGEDIYDQFSLSAKSSRSEYKEIPHSPKQTSNGGSFYETLLSEVSETSAKNKKTSPEKTVDEQTQECMDDLFNNKNKNLNKLLGYSVNNK